MAYSYVDYTGNGTNRDWSVTFEYLKKADVHVLVDDVAVGFTWISSGLIRTNIPAIMGGEVVIKRVTSRSPLVTWDHGSNLKAKELNLATKQAIFLAQEAMEQLKGDKGDPGPTPSGSLNVKDDFGAIGDGIEDDSIAFQNALDAGSLNKLQLYIPAGVYRVKNLTLPTECRIYGPSSAVLKLPDDATFGVGYHDYIFRTLGLVKNSAISGITLDGNSPTVGGDAMSGCPLLVLTFGSTVESFTLDGVTFQNNGYVGQMAMAYVKDYTASNIVGNDTDAVLLFVGGGENIRINGLRASGGTSEAVIIGTNNGEVYDPVPFFQNIAICNVIAKDKTSVTNIFGNVQDVSITNCTGFNSGDIDGTGYLLDNAILNSVHYRPINVSYENCVADRYGIGVKITGENVSWLGGVIRDSGWFGFRVTDAKNIVVSGVSVSGVGRLAAAATLGIGIKIDGSNWYEPGGAAEAQTYGPVESVIVSNCVVESASPKASECISVRSDGSLCRYVTIKDNIIAGWINQGIAAYNVQPIMVFNNVGYRGDTYSLFYNDSPTWCNNMHDNVGGPVYMPSDNPAWDISMYAYGGYLDFMHRDSVSIVQGDGTTYIENIGAAAIYMSRIVRMVMTSAMTLKHGTGNLRCPNGVDIVAKAGSVFDAQVIWGGSSYVWNLTPVGEPRWVPVPATSSSSGAAGDEAYDASYHYICTAINTWRRIAHATW